MTVKARGYISRTGGAAGSLDNTDGSLLIDKDSSIIFHNAEQSVYFYQLDADSGVAESDPDVISPDTNAGDKRHLIIYPYNMPLIENNGSEYIAATFRTNIGLGTIATQNANSVSFTGGTFTGCTNFGSNNASITGGSITLGTAGVTADGDKLQIDYVPTNYSRSIAPVEADALTDLTAHLYGIDQVISTTGSGLAPQSYLWSIFAGNGSDGDATISTSVVLTENKQYNNLTIANGGILTLGLGCDGIAIAGILIIQSGGKINSIGVNASGTTGGVNDYISGTYGDGANGLGSPGNGIVGYNGTYLAGGGGGGGAAASYIGGDGGDGTDAGGAGGAIANPGSNGTNMATPLSWQDLIGSIGGGGGGGARAVTSGTSGAGGSAAKFLYIEANEADLQSGGQLNSYGGKGSSAVTSSDHGEGGGGAGGGIYLRYKIGTALLSTLNVNGGDGPGGLGYNGGDGGLGLYKLEHVSSGSSWGCVIAHYDFAEHGGATVTLDEELPDNAVVIDAWMDIITELDSAGEGASIAIGLEATNDLKTSTGEASYTVGQHDLIPDGTATNMIKINGVKAPTLTITGENLTSGELFLIIRYAVTE